MTIKRFIASNILLLSIMAAVLILAAGGGAFALRQHQLAIEKAAALKAAQDYQKELGQVNTYFSRYNNVAGQYGSLPSTTTKTSDEWDKYFDGLITQLQGISNDSASAIFANDKTATLNKDIQRACDAFVSELNLNKSATDMSFQITADKNQLAADQSTLSSERSIYNDALSSGITLSTSYITEFQGRVSNDNTKLSADQQTLSDQQKQQSQAQMTTLIAQSIMNTDAKVAGIKF